MSLDTRGIDPRRLLPQSLEDRLLGWLGRFGGTILLALSVATAVSLATWSFDDPSLTHTTTALPRNLTGAVGAIFSDLLLQTLGFAAVIALIAPLVWGLELMRSERIPGGHSKLGYYPLSIIAVAGAISALPLVEAWPLRHGFGGLLGDSVLHLAIRLFAPINEARAPLAAGVILAAAAIQLSGKAIGFEPEMVLKDVLRALSKLAKRAVSKLRERASAVRSAPRPSRASRRESRQGITGAGWPWAAETSRHVAGEDTASARAVDDDGKSDVWNGGEREDRPPLAEDRHFASRTLPVPVGFGDDLSETTESVAPEAEFADRGYEFDDSTDASTGAIAARFAPASARIANRQPVPERLKPAPQPMKTTNALLASVPRSRAEPQWKRPSLNVLKRPATSKPRPELSQAAMRGNARLLEDVLADFGVKGEIKDIRPGPVITLYELEPSRGTKSSRVIGLAEDIARSMSLASVRAAIVSGRNAIGLELPNARREAVLLREILEAETFKADTMTLPLGLGKSISGEPVVADLARMPHLLVAGTTGSGKSVGINAMVLSLLYRHAPDECRVLMIDPKMLELSVYDGIPHLLTPVITDPHKAVAALNWAVREMEERYKRMSALSVRNIDVFNNRVRNAKKRGEMLSRTVQTGFDKSGQARFETLRLETEPLPRIVIIVDEFADLMIVAGREVEAAIQRLAQMARAAGIHLIMATQRPSVDIVTGTIKANFPTRISFKTASKIDSRTILNEQGAEQLLGQGDMLYSTGAGQFTRVHGAFVSDEEVVAFADALRQAAAPKYVEGITDVPAAPGNSASGKDGGGDDLYDRAVAIVLKDGKASTSYIQRRLSIGYNRAADLIERMQADGFISEANSVGKREILVPRSGRPAGAAA